MIKYVVMLNVQNHIHEPYWGVKQHTESKYEELRYDDLCEALNSLPIGVMRVAMTVPECCFT
jgi:hypothetical protein